MSSAGPAGNCQDYIQTKVNPTLEAMVTAILLEQPEDPIAFMSTWLSQQGGEYDATNSEDVGALKARIAELEKQVNDLTAQLKGSSGAEGTAYDEEAEEEEDDDEDDEMDDEAFAAQSAAFAQQGAKMRTSVSAEAYGEFNKREAFTPKVFAKSEEQIARLTAVLQKSFMFNELIESEFKIIVDAVEEVTAVQADTAIITEGDAGDCLYIIESGKFYAKKNIYETAADGTKTLLEQKIVKECGPGDAFGELALLYSTPRAASVVAAETSVVWKLDRATFNAIVKEGAMNQRTKREDFLNNVPILEALNQVERANLSEILKRHVYKERTQLIKRGEKGEQFFILESGTASATDESGKSLKDYKEKDYFGELALLGNTVRACDVFVDVDSVVLSVDQASFNRLLGKLEKIMADAKISQYGNSMIDVTRA